MMKLRLACCSAVLLLAQAASRAAAGETPGAVPAPERLQRVLKLFPNADANRDGRLSVAEALAFGELFPGKAKPAKPADSRPAPTHADVRYGPHERNVLDLWLAKVEHPAPLIAFIHGGGFTAGDKAAAPPAAIQPCLDAGVSFMAINYRFRQHAPIQDILRDAARAIQFIRLNAKQYRVDPQRLACFGGSAGAGTSLWLAVHDDLADPSSADPVLRQSSRIRAAGCMNGQASYDLTEWNAFAGPGNRAWLRTADEDVQFYHFQSREDFTSEAGRRVLADCSMLRQITRDDPPLVLTNTNPDTEPANRGAFLHHPRHAKAVQQRCQDAGVPCELHLLGDANSPRGNAARIVVEFLLKQLGAPA